MNYEFPEITDLRSVLAAIGETDGFGITRRHGIVVICYTYISPEVFPDVSGWETAVRRECRGLAFSERSGELLSRPLHKFFNVGERAETHPARIDLARAHTILEKLDGSMIRPIPFGEGYRLGTKNGVTPIVAQPEAFIAAHPAYDRYIRTQLGRGRTPIFEWCSRQQRIVLDYETDRLVLIAVRENRTGRYPSMREVREEIAAEPAYAGIEIVKEHPGTPESLESLLAHTRGLEGNEGFVIRFDDGHMLKVKSEWYVTRHKALSGLQFEKDVVALVRSRLWDPSTQIARTALPSMGEMMEAISCGIFDGKAYDAAYPERIRQTIY
jgi:RNA ligase